MFWKRKSSPAGKGSVPSADREMQALEAEMARRQESVAELELDLLNSQTELAQFNAELEARVSPLQRRLEAVVADLAEARRRASRQALWGARANSPDIPEDVLLQYQRLWGPDPGASSYAAPDAPSTAPSQAEAELKLLYRALAKRFHPDLSPDAAEKPRREQIMARVNAAYHDGDLAALRQLEAEPDQVPGLAAPPAPKTREQILAELRAEIERLDQVKAELERRLDDLARSPAVRLKLDARLARRAGQDLVAELADQLKGDILRAEKELASLR